MTSLSKNKFTGISPGSIDFSPYYPSPVVTIILEDTELEERKDWAMERFWRVWYKERSTYAPALEKLILGLQPQTTSSKGIQKFLDYFNYNIVDQYPKLGLEMYILPDTIDEEPRLIYDYSPKN